MKSTSINRITKYLSVPNVTPLIVRSLSFPIQFAISILVWREIYDSATDSMIQSILIMSSISFFSTILLLGSHTNLGNHTIDGTQVAHEELSFALIAPAVISVLLLPLIFVFSHQIVGFFQIPREDILVLLVVMLSIMFVAPSASFQSVLIARNESAFVSITPLIGSIFSLSMSLVILQDENVSLSKLYLVLVSPSLVSTLLLGIRVSRVFHFEMPRLNKSSIKSYINIGSLLISISAPLAFQLDKVLVVHLGQVEDSLKLGPVNRIVSSVFLILSSAGLAFWPHLRRRKDSSVIRKYTAYSVISCFPFILAIFLIGPKLVAFVTEERISFSLTDAISVSIFILVYSSTIVPIVDLSEASAQIKVFLFMMMSCVATIPLSYIFIPKFGLSGYYLAASLGLFFLVTLPLYSLSIKSLRM